MYLQFHLSCRALIGLDRSHHRAEHGYLSQAMQESHRNSSPPFPYSGAMTAQMAL